MSISQDERERAVFRSRKKYQTDYQSDMATNFDNGKAEGRTERDIEIIRNAHQIRMPIADIAKLMGLSYAEIERLRTES